jgi:hypothetical protein
MDDADLPPALPHGEHVVYPDDGRPSFLGLIVAGIVMGLMLALLVIVIIVRQVDAFWTILGAMTSYLGAALTIFFTPRDRRGWLFWTSILLGFGGLLIVLWSLG